MRDLSGPTQSRAIRDLLQSLFVLEAVRPSRPLWLLSAWVTDAPMLDNGGRQFAAIDPEWGAGPVSLSSVLRTILERGGKINVITRRHELNRPFIEQLHRFEKEYPVRLALLAEEDFHDKGLIGDDYELAGSMNFTRKGIETNSEHLILRTDPRIVAERHLELNARWKSRLDASSRS
jgi:phosphatidylserine/phosphatidylglycerophosphate/cardiolipin synthase-like enzyme